MLVKGCRFDWLFVFERNSKGKYAVCCLIPKEHKATLAAIQTEISAAKERGIADGKFTREQLASKNFRSALRDGDEEAKTGDRPEYYKGHMFFNAYSLEPVGIGRFEAGNVVALGEADKSSFFSGCYGAVEANFYPYKQDGGFGIAAGLNNILMTREGDRLDNRQNVHQAFANFTEDDDSMQ